MLQLQADDSGLITHRVQDGATFYLPFPTVPTRKGLYLETGIVHQQVKEVGWWPYLSKNTFFIVEE